MSGSQPDAGAERQYDPTPYDYGLTDQPEMTWERYAEISGQPRAQPCLVVERESEAEAG